MLKERVDKFIQNPKKALFTLAWPIIIAMFMQTMYNIVDLAFIGRLGVDAIAALTISFPVFFILIALNQGISVGMGSKISRLLGAHDKEGAENAALHGLLISLVSALLIFILSLFLLKPLFILIGAESQVLTLAMDYMFIISLGCFVMFPASTLNSIFAAQGDTRTPTKIQVLGLILNIILDPIFIYTLKLGVKGAAIATVIAFFFGLLLFIYHSKKRSLLRIHFSCFHFSPQLIKEIFFIGLPACLMMIFMSIYFTFANHLMAYFSTAHVAAYGLAARLESLATVPIVAFSVTMVTLVGMFYGAKRYDLIRQIIVYAIKVSLLFISAIGLILFIFPHLFLRIFTSDPQLIQLGAAYLRIEIFIFPLTAVCFIISRAMQGMGLGLPGMVVNLVRSLVVAVPLAYLFVLVLHWSYLSIAVAAVISAFVAMLVALIWLSLKLKKLHLINST